MKKIWMILIMCCSLLWKFGVVVANNEISLNSTNAILYDKTYQTVLYEKNAYKRVANASTTKVLTAIVAYENADVDSMVRVSNNAANTAGFTIGLKSGDIVSLEDLLKGLLIRSGNDAAVAIAEYIGGDVESFCIMLNEKAREMGLNSTNFVTPHGLDANNHYSSAYDLAKMAEYLLDIDYLANIVRQKEEVITINNEKKVLISTNEMLSLYEGVNGIKTGYTGNAGRCLITSCTIDNRTVISVVLGCGTKSQRTRDSIQLLDYAFNQYEIVNICKNMKQNLTFRVLKGEEEYFFLKLNKEIYFPIKRNNLDKISYEYHILDQLIAPVRKGEKIGAIKVCLGQNEVLKIEIVMPYDVCRKGIRGYFRMLLGKI